MENSPKSRVLVIDDDDYLRKLCRIVLEDAGYEVHLASNGAAGMKVIDEQPIDLVICDIFMPEMDGIETIMALQRQLHGTKVLAISGAAGGLPDLLPAAAKLGAIRTLQKPFSTDALVDAVRSLLADQA